MKILTIITLIITLSGCASTSKVGDSTAVSPDRELIYDLLFKHLSLGDNLQYVRCEFAVLPSAEQIPEAKGLFDGYHHIDKAERNKIEYFGESEIILIDQVVLDDIFKNGCEEGWKQFNLQYSESRLLLGISNIMTNSDGNKSAVYYEFGSGCLLGMGVVIYFEKSSGEWMIESEKYVWGGY